MPEIIRHIVEGVRTVQTGLTRDDAQALLAQGPTAEQITRYQVEGVQAEYLSRTRGQSDNPMPFYEAYQVAQSLEPNAQVVEQLRKRAQKRLEPVSFRIFHRKR